MRGVERRESGRLMGSPVQLETGAGRSRRAGAVGRASPRQARPEVEADRAAIRRIEKDEIGGDQLRREQARLAVKGLERSRSIRDVQIQTPEDSWRARPSERELRGPAGGAAKMVDGHAATVVALGYGRREGAPTLDVFRAFRRIASRPPSGPSSTFPALGVRCGRPARVEHRGRHLPGHLRHRDDDASDGRAGGSRSACWPAIYLRRICQAGLARPRRCASPSTTWPAFPRSSSASSASASSSTASAAASTGSSFPKALPTPTFGTGGILWASPDARAAHRAGGDRRHRGGPRAPSRAASAKARLALGATKWQTLLRVVLPAASPGILTGFILAMARGAGEVAPLMLTGVVKLAPDPAARRQLSRSSTSTASSCTWASTSTTSASKSPNVEAAKPMVF